MSPVNYTWKILSTFHEMGPDFAGPLNNLGQVSLGVSFEARHQMEEVEAIPALVDAQHSLALVALEDRAALQLESAAHDATALGAPRWQMLRTPPPLWKQITTKSPRHFSRQCSPHTAIEPYLLIPNLPLMFSTAVSHLPYKEWVANMPTHASCCAG